MIKVVIKKVLQITPSKRHAWVETNIGKLRKPLSSIPEKLLKEANAL